MSPYVRREATLEAAQQLGLSADEFEAIKQQLGRTPNFTELSMFSVMWSEHCSYKNSLLWLKQLPKEGPAVMAKAGEENAGLLDIGGGMAVAFKIESHNHPSAIEPFQGAATGVGGIHRDIFTMGARPIATLNSLRFGDPSLAKTRHLLKGVIDGIAHYGNAFGVPTVGGEMYFDPCYNTNPLVNAMSVGIVSHDGTISAKSEGAGNPVYIVGSATGKDGIHGASFASEDINADSAENLPSVQVGDPFAEKNLLEASLEVIATGAVVGMQDMGAAGITCSTAEMSEKGGFSMRIDLEKCPMRQEGMLPFELLLSESQERMLIVAEKGREEEVLEVFAKWDLPCVQIGEVTEGEQMQYYWHGELVAEMPAPSLCMGEGAPQYERSYKRPGYFDDIDAFDQTLITEPEDYPATLREVLQIPSIANKRPLTRQYDSMVGAATLTTNRPADAAAVKLLGTEQAIAATTDCNSRYVYLDPFNGTAHAVAEGCRNLVCTGAKPLGITNCLNFGNPYNEEVYYQFAYAIQGMKAACEQFGLPVTGGNVSFYNQSSDDGPVFPTPTIGIVGLIDDCMTGLMTLDFKREGDVILILGELRDEIQGSEYLYRIKGIRHSPAPYLDLAAEHRLQQLMLALIGNGHLQSAHDCSEGGIAVSVLESCFPNGLGAKLELSDDMKAMRLDALLFGESGGRVIVSASPEEVENIQELAAKHDYQAQYLGEVGGERFTVDGQDFGRISELQSLYDNALVKLFKADVVME
ncbi:MAG: phosphoribosylformylglycinamidine synthase subunit PurL [Bacteroidota bacterium]